MLFLQPHLKDALWGGHSLFARYRKGSGERLAESWELSTHRDGHSRLSDGCTLQDRLAAEPGLAGEAAHRDGTLSILAKLIDAHRILSVQVHPDGDYARLQGEASGKTEYWYILDAEPGAWLYYGLRGRVTRADMEAHVHNGTIESVLQKVPVRAGDAFFIPSGTLHAIGAGILCFELQQNSNLTYRVFDYNRRDDNGNPRILHIKEALDVASLSPTPRAIPGLGQSHTINGLTRRMMVKCKEFAMEELTLDGDGVVDIPPRPYAGLFVVDGQCLATSRHNQSIQTNGDEQCLMAGQTVFLAAQESVLLQGRARAFLFSPSGS